MAKVPQPKFMTLGRSKYVHVIRTKAYDSKNSDCAMVRKHLDTINYKDRHLSAEAALALEPCPQCGTHIVAEMVVKQARTPADRQAAAADTRQRLAREAMSPAERRKAEKAPKAAAKGKASKPARTPAVTKSGPRSVGGQDEKVKALHVFAEEHGWAVKTEDAKPGVRLVAKRGDETIRCTFVDGKYDTVRFATVTVGSWSGKLRGVHGCRKQMADDNRPHPNPGKGRSAPRKKEVNVPDDESPEDARQRVPFSLDDDPVAIIDSIKGKVIHWRNGVSGGMEQALLPSVVKGKNRDRITVYNHPKENRLIMSFMSVDAQGEHEQYGGERSVYLDKIVKVEG